jgi:hypothetical protein
MVVQLSKQIKSTSRIYLFGPCIVHSSEGKNRTLKLALEDVFLDQQKSVVVIVYVFPGVLASLIMSEMHHSAST